MAGCKAKVTLNSHQSSFQNHRCPEVSKSKAIRKHKTKAKEGVSESSVTLLDVHTETSRVSFV